MTESNGDRLIAWANECLILLDQAKTYRFKAILAQDVADIYKSMAEGD